VTGTANHGLCVACGAPHDRWPAIDEPDGELCDECFAAEADDAWWDTPAPTGREAR
jgi:hypothetical protein